MTKRSPDDERAAPVPNRPSMIDGLLDEVEDEELPRLDSSVDDLSDRLERLRNSVTDIREIIDKKD